MSKSLEKYTQFLSFLAFKYDALEFDDLTKDNYIGLEALQSATREKKIFGVLSKSIIPKNGYQVSSKAGAVAVVTTGALSPHLDSGVGICRLSYPQNVFHGKMILSAPDGKEAECILVDLPFFDKNKQIPRTL